MSTPSGGDDAGLRGLNTALKGATGLLRFDLRWVAGQFDLALTLGENGSPVIEVRFGGVQNLELNPAGSGFDRLLRLEVEDMAEDDLAGIRYAVEELERETLFLHCASFSYTLL